jgi:shikimate dehydrogenase
MRSLGIMGLSVTMPHKAAVASSLDALTPVATLLGAVNCVLRRGDHLVGDSTDGEGLLLALKRAVDFEPGGARCAVIGAGGAARAVVLALADAGATDVVVVNRTPAHAESAAALAGRAGRVGSSHEVADADLVVQATPLGMTGSAALPIDPGCLRPGQLVVDLVYAPPLTPFLEAARARRCRIVGGIGMLVHQAALAIERWTGLAAPVEAMWAVAEPYAPK